MNQLAPITEGRAVSPQQQFRDDLTRMADQFIAALPEHIRPERFQRIVLTAVLGDPALLNADRKSLLEAAMRAAQDGLLPDKREGAFVVFGRVVQWMPMIGGIIKKIHQSGEIAMMTAKVVYGGDTFRAWVDDAGEHVNYEQAEYPDYDTIRQVFALAKTKEGAIYVETLTPRDIEKIRNVSRSKNSGPWVTWWEEMAKKSAIRRLAKRLPLSAEVHDLIQRDNEMYDLSQAPEDRPSLADRLRVGRQAVQEPRGREEGFDRGEVPSEPENASSGPEIEQEPGSATPSDPAGSGDVALPGDPAADQSQAEVEAEPKAAASIDLSEADLAWLKQTAKMLWAATGVNEIDTLRSQMTGVRENYTPAEISKAARDRGMSIFAKCKLVCFGEADAADTLEYIAGIAGCETKEIV